MTTEYKGFEINYYESMSKWVGFREGIGELKSEQLANLKKNIDAKLKKVAEANNPFEKFDAVKVYSEGTTYAYSVISYAGLAGYRNKPEYWVLDGGRRHKMDGCELCILSEENERTINAIVEISKKISDMEQERYTLQGKLKSLDSIEFHKQFEELA